MRFNSCSSCCSFTELAVGLTEFGCCACAGAARPTRSNKAHAPSARRKVLTRDAITQLHSTGAARQRRNGVSPSLHSERPPSGVDRLPIGRLPAPGAGAVAALGHPLL